MNPHKFVKFGVELEYHVLNGDGTPAYGFAEKVIKRTEVRNLVPELGSFQLELNPGPWNMDESGIQKAIDDLKNAEEKLRTEIKIIDSNKMLSTNAFLPRVDESIVNHTHFFTKGRRYRASCNYFSKRSSELELSNKSTFILPGESGVACINEIHFHVQLDSDNKNISLFNFLNENGESIVEDFKQPIYVNGSRFSEHCTTQKIFEQANGELSKCGTYKRVGYLPHDIRTSKEYFEIIKKFRPISLGDNITLPLEDTVYFWVRLRGNPGNLRVEFRPIEMSSEWDQRILRFMEIVISYCKSLF